MQNNSQPSAAATDKKIPKKSGVIQANRSDLAPHPKNPRTIKKQRLDTLVESLREFPEMLTARPLVVITNTEFPEVKAKYLVLGGNKRLEAADVLKIAKIPVFVADHWNEKQRKQFMIKDNINYGDWDYSRLFEQWDTKELQAWGLELKKMPKISELIERDIPKPIKVNIMVTAELKHKAELAKAIQVVADKFNATVIITDSSTF